MSPFYRVWLGATGGTLVTSIVLGILVTLKERCSKFSHSLCSQEMEA